MNEFLFIDPLEITLSKKYIVQAEETRQPAGEGDPVLIFNDFQYLALNPKKLISFYLKNRQTGYVAGFCHFQCVKADAWSPLLAPFASIYLKKEIDFHLIGVFIRSMTGYLEKQGISRIHLAHYPDIYSVIPPDKLIAALLFEGFQIKQTDINHYLKISEQPFEVSVRPMQKRRIRKCEDLGYIFRHHKNNELEILFSRIQEFRMQKNIPVKISMERIRSLVDHFPDRYFLFSVQDKGQIIAATMMVSVNATVLYNFLPASDEAYNTSSPMVYLIRNLYEFAQAKRYKYIDLGVSSIKNQPQSGLITFKENLGGIPGIKFQLEKTFNSDNV
jgi:hypothetical protein